MDPSKHSDPFEVASPESSTAQTGTTGVSTSARVDAPEEFKLAGERADSPSTFTSNRTAKTSPAIPLESLADFNDEGETGWNAQGRAEIARKMQRIAAGANHYSHDELQGAVIRAEQRVFAEVSQ